MTLGERPSELGRSVLELLAEAGHDLQASCGGGGRCGQCLVHVVAGSPAPQTELERQALPPLRLAEGWRLACQARLTGPLTIAWEGSPAAPGKGFAEPLRRPSRKPPLVRRQVSLPPSAGPKQQGDWERLCTALGVSTSPEFGACESLSGLARAKDPVAVILRHGAPIGLAADGRLLGAVFDLGTTTVAGGLVDLETGNLLAVRSAFNAQRVFGADVLSRLGQAEESPEGRHALQDRILGQVRSMLHTLLDEVGAAPANLVDLVVVGNTAMEHLFCGFGVSGLAVLPFAPVHQAGLEVPARIFGLPAHPGARVYFPPNLAGFVGADTVAGLVATDLPRLSGPSLLVDLGTNGELVLADRGRLWACSTAAGPAFEGAEIGCGMPGLPGAIERVDLIDGDLRLHTIDRAAPRGLCGSGLLDAAAVLLEAGVIEPTGRIRTGEDLPAALARRIRAGAGGAEVLLAAGGGRDLTLTQPDVRQVQLAKGAIAAGIRLLCKAAGLAPESLSRVLLAGAFGLHLDVAKAARLGLLPGVPVDRVQVIGNAAGEGARLILTNSDCRDEAESYAGRVEAIELASDPEFQAVFAEEMLFPE